MRQIATLPEGQARTFADHLLTLGITTRVDDPGADGSAVWVHKEELIGRAKQELEAFLERPDDPRYRSARSEAEAIRRRQEKADREHARNTVDLRTRMGKAAALGPITRGLLAVSVAVFVLDWVGFGVAGRPLAGWLFFTDWLNAPGGGVVDRGFGPILGGQFWRLITPIFVHGNLMHIFFNMYMLVNLGGAIERRRRAGEYALLVLATALASNVAQYAMPDVFTVPTARVGAGPFGGMSGVIYGLFGYAWMRGRYDPASGLVLHPQTVTLLLIWLVVCAFNLIGPIANTAHVAGLLAGMAFAFASMARDGVFR